MYNPLSHAYCWNDRDPRGETWWWDNGMLCPEQGHPDHN